MTVSIGVLWDYEIDHEGDEPMKKDDGNRSYARFSELAADENAEVYMANYRKYSDGKLSESYKWNGENWERKKDIELDVVFDKFKFDETTVELKKNIQSELPMLNAFGLEEVCKDKLLTYQSFPEFVPETALADKETVRKVLEKDGKAILKPRFGSEGMEVRLIDSLEEFEPADNLLVQRYVDPSGGTPHFDFEGAHDFRVMIADGEPVACYYRLNEASDLANVSMGGSRKFVDVDEIPETVLDLIETVSNGFSELDHTMYSVDVMFDSEMNPWIIELSSKPGLVFDDEDSEKRKVPVMEKVIRMLVDMAQS
ncbi:ATP-grasp domain-containing protein [Candidatus Nanohalococcus occultus]|uniref:ATP-grasp domain-containing protein n=1 Tax=Candidatus Nanohalococcus occultus TaxID=2978047 RepID=UPI0039E05516